MFYNPAGGNGVGQCLAVEALANGGEGILILSTIHWFERVRFIVSSSRDMMMMIDEIACIVLHA